MLGALLTHAVANRLHRSPFFFSRFNFERMREAGNTHYCFHCGGDQGFTPDAEGKATNAIRPGGKYNPCEHHDASHEDATIANADKYSDAWDFLEGEIPKKGKSFPYVVNIPSV